VRDLLVEPELFFAVDFAFDVDPEVLFAFAVVLRGVDFFGAAFRALDVDRPDELRADELRADELRPDEPEPDVLRPELRPDVEPEEPLRLLLEPPDERPLSFESSSPSSELISFFATPTAAGIATPSAVPATTFWVVERPSSSLFAMVTSRGPRLRRCAVYFASLNVSMNFGMIRSRSTSGP